MRVFLLRYWVEVVVLIFVTGCLVYFFGWHEFDAVRSWLAGG